MVRTSFWFGAASVLTNFWIGALSTPRSCDSACARVGRDATFSRSLPGNTSPPRDTRVATSLSLSFEKALTTRAAAPGSSFEKANTSGPFNLGPTGSKAVPANALRASVFLITRMNTPSARAFARREVICVTVSPRYSAATTERAVFATSATSATSTFLSSRLSGISTPPGQSHYIFRKHLSLIRRAMLRSDRQRPSSSAEHWIAVHHLRRPSRLRSCGLLAPAPPAVLDGTCGARKDAASPHQFFKYLRPDAERRLVDDYAGTHGRGQRDALQVDAFGRRRLRLVEVVDQSDQIVLQMLRLEL